jgi:hypothetical protein
VNKIGSVLPTRGQCKIDNHIGLDEGDLAGGEDRTTEQPGLASLHTLFLNEHNRVAGLLKEELRRRGRLAGNTEVDDRLVYEEARRIVVAEVGGEYPTCLRFKASPTTNICRWCSGQQSWIRINWRSSHRMN